MKAAVLTHTSTIMYILGQKPSPACKSKYYTYRCLYHKDTTSPQLLDTPVDVHDILSLNPLHLSINGNEGTGPTHSSTAVYQEGHFSAVWVDLAHPPDEVDE